MVNGMCVGGGEGLQHRGVGSPAEDLGVGSLTLWPMLKLDGHAAWVKRVELHPSGSWCNEIRNVEISVLV